VVFDTDWTGWTGWTGWRTEPTFAGDIVADFASVVAAVAFFDGGFVVVVAAAAAAAAAAVAERAVAVVDFDCVAGRWWGWDYFPALGDL